MYYRFTQTENPMSDYGHAMFVLDDRDRVDNYGKYEHHYDGGGGVKIEDLYEAITAAWEGAEEWERIKTISPQLTAEEVCEMFTPEDIVDSANGFDNGEAMQWLWEQVLDGPGIMAVITPDGAIVFDEKLIRAA